MNFTTSDISAHLTFFQQRNTSIKQTLKIPRLTNIRHVYILASYILQNINGATNTIHTPTSILRIFTGATTITDTPKHYTSTYSPEYYRSNYTFLRN